MVEVMVSLDGGQTVAAGLQWTKLGNTDPDYYSTSPSAIILVAVSFWALFVSIPGLAWHIKNRNLPAATMIGWIVYLNLINIINALLWSNDNISNWWDGQIYCDIVIKLDIAGGMGLVGSLACIMRALAQALDTNNIRLMPSRGQRIRQHILEIFLCVVLPLTLALLHFAIQPLRFYIFAIAGCEASYSNHWYTILLSFMWPPVICMLNSYYAILLSFRIHRYRKDFSSVLAASTSGMNQSRFLRLFISALVVLFVALPTQAYALYVNAINGMNDSWTPESWQTIVFVPTYGVVFPDCWIHVGISIPVFLCFGWGKDANSVYRSWLRLLGFTKLFPTLAQANHTLPPPLANKKPAFNDVSDASTLLGKIERLFSTNKSNSSPGASILPSQASSRSPGLKLEKHYDIESRNQDVELLDQDTATDGDSPTTASFANIDTNIIDHENLATHAKSRFKSLQELEHHIERSLTL